jgi:hypothetical protein
LRLQTAGVAGAAPRMHLRPLGGHDMQPRRHYEFKTSLLALLTGITGCSLETPTTNDIERVEQAIVNTDATTWGPNDTVFEPPATGMSATVNESSYWDVSPSAMHGTRFSNGADLRSRPSRLTSTWLTRAAGDQFSTTPEFVPRLNDALGDAASAPRGTVDPSAISGAFASIARGFGRSAAMPLILSDFFGYPPPRARFRTRDSVVTPRFMDNYVYPAPSLFNEARLRAARLYCAARRGQFEQGRTGRISMGTQALAHLHVFGRVIDFMTVEPTVVINDPAARLGAGDDGAQAFSVPIQIGSRITPVSLLTGLGEVRAPLVFVSGDTEVGTHETLPWEADGKRYLDYKTLSHADATVTQSGTVDQPLGELTLFTIGVVDVRLDAALTARIGTLKQANERALGHDSGIAPFGLLPRAAAFEGSIPSGARYCDAPFMLSSGTATVPSPNPAAATSSIGWSSFCTPSGGTPSGGTSALPDLAPTDPMLARLLQDDDHTLFSRHDVGFSGNLTVGFGLDLGVVGIKLDVAGGIGVRGGPVQEVRDAVVLAGGEEPVSMLSVTPHMEVSGEQSTSITLRMWFGPFRFQRVLSNHNSSLPLHEGPEWDELHRFRLGYGASHSSGLGPMKQPSVTSHLPLDPVGFESFPLGSDVDACLGDPTPLPPPPPLCPPNPPTASAPVIRTCLSFRTPPSVPAFPPNVCADPAPYLGLFGAERACMTKLVSVLCEPTSFQEGITGLHHVTRAAPGVSEDVIREEAERISAMMQTCDDVHGAGWSQANFSINACRDDGRPFSENEPAISLETGTNTPLGPGSCGSP